MAEKGKFNNRKFQELKCIWMTSGLVDYKLCDMSFECEDCQFDKVMRNAPSARRNSQLHIEKEKEKNAIDSAIEHLTKDNFEDGIIYLKNSIMLKHLFDNTYYLGINSVALSFMDNINSIQNFEQGNYILKDKAIFRFTGDWGSVTIPSPMNFFLLDMLSMSPPQLIANKWFAIVSVSPQDVTTSKITQYDWKKEQANSIRLLSDYKTRFPNVGATMMDGGERIKYLYQVMGKVEYLKILKRLFNN